MLDEPTLKETKRIILEERNLGSALKRLHAFMADRQWLSSNAQLLESIENDYQLMCDFMMRGFRDDKRSEVYDNLLRKTYRFVCDLELQVAVRGANISLREAANSCKRRLCSRLKVMRRKKSVRRNSHSSTSNMSTGCSTPSSFRPNGTKGKLRR